MGDVHRSASLCTDLANMKSSPSFVLLIAACAAFRTYAQHAVSLRRT